MRGLSPAGQRHLMAGQASELLASPRDRAGDWLETRGATRDLSSHGLQGPELGRTGSPVRRRAEINTGVRDLDVLERLGAFPRWTRADGEADLIPDPGHRCG